MAFHTAHAFHDRASVETIPNDMDEWYRCMLLQHSDPVRVPNSFHMPLECQTFQQILELASNHGQQQRQLDVNPHLVWLMH